MAPTPFLFYESAPLAHGLRVGRRWGEDIAGTADLNCLKESSVPHNNTLSSKTGKGEFCQSSCCSETDWASFSGGEG